VYRRVVTLKLTDVSEVRTAMIALMMEAVSISETSVNFNVTTWRHIPEESKHHTRRRENPKSHTENLYLKKNLMERSRREVDRKKMYH
jgi:hypothetical protein